VTTPFTTAQFLEVFARYNQAVWPAPLLFYLLAALVLCLAWRPQPGAGKAIAGVLAFFWAWMAVIYHWVFFRAVNPAAALFGAAFLLQAALLFHAGLMRPRLAFRVRPGPAGSTGTILVVYALVAYPLLGTLFGEGYPRDPTFGLPCPTTIFTLGVLLWAEEQLPVRLLVIPIAWSLIATVAAAQHGIVQDYALPASGLAAAVLVPWMNRRGAAHPAPARSPGDRLKVSR
jgi:hypothetical protein